MNKSLTLLAVILLMTACVTQRKKDEAHGIKLFFHNLQGKYNGYFNANVLVQDATEKLEIQHIDNFNQVLDVYPALAVDNPQSAAPDLDKAVEKVAVVGTFHRPSHWVDDCYLLMGKAQYLKHDFESAEETFFYLTEFYNPSKKSKLSKKDREEASKERKKEQAQDRKEKQQARENKFKQAQQERDDALKEKARAKQEAAQTAEKERILREKELKELKENKAKLSKEERESKMQTLEQRNEARKKANELAAEQRRKEREDKIAKGNKKPDKTPEPTPSETKTQTPQYPTTENADVAKTELPKLEKAPEDVKKGGIQKPKAKPDRYFLKHRPCYQEAVVWLARTYTERQNYADAEILLNQLEKDPKTFKDVRAMAAVAKSHLYLKQNNYDAAVPALENAVKLARKKKERARLAFILAQLQQKRGNNAQAYQMFDKVLSNNPPYEMEFNARLNITLNDQKTTAEQNISNLLKMAKNFKNKEYGAQIYFTLAQIALKNNQKVQAFDYLKQSLALPSRNPQEKAEAYYLAAQMQFETENYVISKTYYDSAANAFNTKDDRRADALKYAANLADISRNIEIIKLQDSLLRISDMTDKEQRDLAIKIKKSKADALKAASATPSVKGGSDIDLAEAARQSRFFGYNIESVKRGKREFEKKWGTDRRNEDNWNRTNKRSSSDFNKIDAAIAANELTDKELKDMFKGVPKTTEEKDASTLKVDDAMFQLGTLYHDKLQNDKKAIETLEAHLSRFQKSKHELEDWYYLNLSYMDLKNNAKANGYLDKIMAKYPTSNYARILKNGEEIKPKDETVESYYATTYAFFKNNKHKEAQERILVSSTKFGLNNPLKGKFALLNAICTGRLKGKEAYVAALRDVMAKFPDSPEDKRAQEILRILASGAPDTESPTNKNSDNPDDDELAAKFAVGDDKLHYVIVILSKSADIEDAKIGVSDFNSLYFRTENLNISSIFLNTETETGVLVVRKFKDKALAKVYTEGVEKNKKDFMKGTYDVFAVSQDNYREILRQKSVEHYRKFYNKNYK